MTWEQAPAELPAGESLHRQLARELHDGVAQALTTMLIEIEGFKLDQHGRPVVIQRLSGCQETIREVLNELRGLLFELRGEPTVSSGFISSLKSAYGVQFRRRSGITVRIRVSRSWPAVIRARTARHLAAIVDEALSFGAPSPGKRAHVELTVAGEEAMLAVRTTGGVDSTDSAADARLHAIRLRVIMLGGAVNIRSEAGDLNLSVAFPAHQLAGDVTGQRPALVLVP